MNSAAKICILDEEDRETYGGGGDADLLSAFSIAPTVSSSSPVSIGAQLHVDRRLLHVASSLFPSGDIISPSHRFCLFLSRSLTDAVNQRPVPSSQHAWNRPHSVFLTADPALA